VVNLAIGLGSAYLLAQTGPLSLACAGLLFQLASAFDGVDGEMARSTLSESVRGAWLDTAVDTSTYAACLAGVAIGWAREGMGASGLAIGAVLVASIAITLVALMRFVHRYGPDGSLVFVDRCVERAARDSGLLTLKLARFLFYLLRRDVFAMLFFVISLAGSRTVVPVVVTVGTLLALATLIGHRSQLLAAARALSPKPA
jgi:CDP-L-myo-inositol myo-inositolphosphotransferase